MATGHGDGGSLRQAVASVSLVHVTKRFGRTVAVRDLTLEVREGEFLVLLGPSGSGKTTTLRLVAGLEELTEGAIYMNGAPVHHLPPKDRGVAMVFQHYALYPHMNVYDNIAFPLRQRRLSPQEVDRRVREAARMLGLENLLHRRPRELSGGQRQRVAVARALARRPRVLLMDEPLAHLDPPLRLQARSELLRLQRELGTTVLYVTHDQAEAMSLADRLAVLREGELQQVGHPLEVYRRPANLFVAGFVGSPPMNLLAGTLRAREGAWHVELEGFALPVCAASGGGPGDGPGGPGGPGSPGGPGGSDGPSCLASPAARDGQPVVVGVRPEAVQLEGPQPEDDGGARPQPASLHRLEGRVRMVEPLGSHSYVHVAVGPYTLVARAGATAGVTEGQRCRVVVHLDQLHLFDGETGRRL